MGPEENTRGMQFCNLAFNALLVSHNLNISLSLLAKYKRFVIPSDVSIYRRKHLLILSTSPGEAMAHRCRSTAPGRWDQ